MATDPLSDAEDEMTEQAKWGLRRSDRAMVKVLASFRTLLTRFKSLEDRAKALEDTLPPRLKALEDRVKALEVKQ